ncbi:MAG: NAD(P)-binding domain-containing protein [Minisyncoccia bacterium]
MNRTKKTVRVGFIGQGWIGKHMADDFVNRGYKVIRYALEPQHEKNKEEIAKCDIVFIAVPTPTTPKGFDSSILKKVIPLIGKGKIAVIKSTIIPGTTEMLQKFNPKIIVTHSPEFLTEKTAAYDSAHPDRNIVGIPKENKKYKAAAKKVLSVLPPAPYKLITNSKTAELIKYAGNTWFYTKVVYVNMLYDLSKKLGLDWETVAVALSADPRIGKTHLRPVHQGGRGAGGHCFIKDFEALLRFYEKTIGDKEGVNLFHALRTKNNKLLTSTKKDLDIFYGVYGKKK